MRCYAKLIQECWASSPLARLPALRVKKTACKLRTNSKNEVKIWLLKLDSKWLQIISRIMTSCGDWQQVSCRPSWLSPSVTNGVLAFCHGCHFIARGISGLCSIGDLVLCYCTCQALPVSAPHPALVLFQSIESLQDFSTEVVLCGGLLAIGTEMMFICSRREEFFSRTKASVYWVLLFATRLKKILSLFHSFSGQLHF